MAGTIQLSHRAVGRVSLPARFLGDAAAGASERRAAGLAWRVPIVVLALVMFAQCFQYMIDIPPLYLLSKSWPFVTLPLFVWALLRLDMPLKVLLIVTLVWIIGVTPMMGIIQLGNDFTAALATTAKVWPFTYAFSLVGLLVWLRVPRQALSGTILWMGAATYVIMLALWIVVPTSAYGGGDVVTKLFMYDPERGYHLYMPMFFGMLLIFFLNRSFWIQPRLWKLALLAICFVLQFVIYKERTAIAAGALVVVVACASSAGRWRTAALAMLALAAGAGAFYVGGRMQQAADLQALGGSLAGTADIGDDRLELPDHRSMALALGCRCHDPLRQRDPGAALRQPHVLPDGYRLAWGRLRIRPDRRLSDGRGAHGRFHHGLALEPARRRAVAGTRRLCPVPDRRFRDLFGGVHAG